MWFLSIAHEEWERARSGFAERSLGEEPDCWLLPVDGHVVAWRRMLSYMALSDAGRNSKSDASSNKDKTRTVYLDETIKLLTSIWCWRCFRGFLTTFVGIGPVRRHFVGKVCTVYRVDVCVCVREWDFWWKLLTVECWWFSGGCGWWCEAFWLQLNLGFQSNAKSI